MKHVFVESNWVFDVAAPRMLQNPAALNLLERAQKDELRLHLPAICLKEAERSIRKKCQPRSRDLKEFRRWARSKSLLNDDESESAVAFLNKYDRMILQDLAALPDRLREIRRNSGVEVFALSEQMLEQAIALELTHHLDLKPFDESILAAILVRGRALRDSGESDVLFCELDGDLRPWDKSGRRPDLARLYDEAHVWVCGGYSLDWPARPDPWPTLSSGT